MNIIKNIINKIKRMMLVTSHLKITNGKNYILYNSYSDGSIEVIDDGELSSTTGIIISRKTIITY